MPRIRRKKKTSISSDDVEDVDAPIRHVDSMLLRPKSSAHEKHRGGKKSDVEHLPTIEDESKVEVYFATIWIVYTIIIKFSD